MMLMTVTYNHEAEDKKVRVTRLDMVCSQRGFPTALRSLELGLGRPSTQPRTGVNNGSGWHSYIQIKFSTQIKAYLIELVYRPGNTA